TPGFAPGKGVLQRRDPAGGLARADRGRHLGGRKEIHLLPAGENRGRSGEPPADPDRARLRLQTLAVGVVNRREASPAPPRPRPPASRLQSFRTPRSSASPTWSHPPSSSSCSSSSWGTNTKPTWTLAVPPE